MTTTQRIENILKYDQSSRNSDKRLWLVFAQKAGMQLSDIQIAVFNRMPSMETIRRTRQKLQELGKYPADPEVDKKRYEKFKATRANINYVSPEKLLEDQGYKILEWGQ